MLNLQLCHWSSQLFDMRAPLSTDVPVLLLNQPDVGYERAGPLQRSKELVGLGDDSIMCVSSLRSRRLEVFG